MPFMVKVVAFLRLFHEVHLAAPPVFGDFGLHLWSSSGVVTEWHGWTMSRGPGAKGASRAHKFERVQWSRIKLFEKNQWSRAPIS